MIADEFLKIHQKYGAANYAPFPVIIKRAKNHIVWDVNNNSYLDFHSCYSANGIGYGNLRLLSTLISQIINLGGAIARGIAFTDQLVLAEKEVAEFCEMERVLFMNSGGEACDTAVKLARKWAYQIKGVPKYKAEIILCKNNFHGRTIFGTSAFSELNYRKNFGPFLPGIKLIPFNNIEALKKAITPNTAAFMLEPIQCEGGIIVPSPNYLSTVAQICKDNNILLILDEIQTGLGRTGCNFAWQWFGAKPDILLIGKFLGGGIIPISAVLSSSNVMCFEPGEHGSTYGGNPIACAIAREVIKIIKEENLSENARLMGKYLLELLKEIKSPYVKEVRGLGLLVGIELKKTAPPASYFVEKLLKRGLICSIRGQGKIKDRVIGITPPLNIQLKEIQYGINLIKSVLTK